MAKQKLFALWGVLFIICAALGFIPRTGEILGTLLGAVSVIFFVPPALLLRRARREGDEHTRKLIRNLAMASLGLTLVCLVLNVACAVYSQALGNVLHCLLAVISTPMLCSGYWALSLFLWACVLMASLKK